MFYDQDHLRITKVRTVNGTMPVFDEQGKVQTKVIFAPDNSHTRKLFDDQNSRLPNQLKMKIERIKGYTPQPAEQFVVQNTAEVDALKAQIEALQKEKAEFEEALLKSKEAAKEVVSLTDTETKD